jgi:hypothetical protein
MPTAVQPVQPACSQHDRPDTDVRPTVPAVVQELPEVVVTYVASVVATTQVEVEVQEISVKRPSVPVIETGAQVIPPSLDEYTKGSSGVGEPEFPDSPPTA